MKADGAASLIHEGCALGFFAAVCPSATRSAASWVIGEVSSVPQNRSMYPTRIHSISFATIHDSDPISGSICPQVSFSMPPNMGCPTTHLNVQYSARRLNRVDFNSEPGAFFHVSSIHPRYRPAYGAGKCSSPTKDVLLAAVGHRLKPPFPCCLVYFHHVSSI